MSEAITSADGLVAAGLLEPERRDEAARVAARYAVAITPYLAGKLPHSAALRRQFVPGGEELETLAHELADPIADGPHSPVKGIVHRYPDRVLLKAVSVCPVYCRFCFRREMVGPGSDGVLAGADLDAALSYIAAHEEIWEVILTGGDPLVLSARRLAALMARLGQIAHVKVVRVHSRVPVVDPGRIDADLVAALGRSGKAAYVAIHANHPDEFTPEARAAIARLKAGGVNLVSQSVLLRGVNDDVEVLTALMRGFVELGVMPYYLHHPDLAPGTSHFRLPIAEGQKLVAALRGRLSGLCQPTYVLDIPGGYGKADIGTAEIAAEGEGAYVVTDYRGGRHEYRDG
jgi:lysine 2,3-aminomutase